MNKIGIMTTKTFTSDRIRKAEWDPSSRQLGMFAQTHEDVADAVRHCVRFGFPVIAHGAGSWLESQLLAVQGGIARDLAGMNVFVAIDPQDLTATLQAGVTHEQLNAGARDLPRQCRSRISSTMTYGSQQLAYFAHRLTLRGAADSMDRMASALLVLRRCKLDSLTKRAHKW